jgi:hypothetical protein
MAEVLKTERAQQKRQCAQAHQSCNLFITNHDWKNSLG